MKHPFNISATLLLTLFTCSVMAEKVSKENIQPLLDKYCVSCHGPKKQKGKFRLDTLDKHLAGKNKEEWNLVLESLSYEEMPPEDEKQPTLAERMKLVEFLSKSLAKKGEEPKEKTAKKEATPHKASSPHFKDKIFPILDKYCIKCHGPNKQKAQLRIDTLNPDMIKGFDGDHWHELLNTMNVGEMPPEDSKQLSDEERVTLIDWMNEELEKAKKEKSGQSQTVIRRLTKEQYTNSLQDLLGIKMDFGKILPPDGLSEEGFTNNGQTLTFSPLHIDYFVKVAHEALDQAIVNPSEKPVTHRYKWTFGTGQNQTNYKPGLGFQAAPLEASEYRVDLFKPSKSELQNETFKPEGDIRRRFYADMRGSKRQRYWVDKEGITLLPTIPHEEKDVNIYQGPAPNLKGVMRDFPMKGDFRIVIEAAKASSARKVKVTGNSFVLNGFKAVSKYNHKKKELTAKAAKIIKANKPVSGTNYTTEDSMVLSKGDGKTTLTYEVNLPRAGIYQVDAVLTTEEQRSVKFSIDGQTVEKVAEYTTEGFEERFLRNFALLAIKLPKGKHTFTIESEGKIPRFSHFVFNYNRKKQITDIFAGKKVELLTSTEEPSLRAFSGNRTDDGMDYTSVGKLVKVKGDPGQFRKYSFYGRLEDAKLPVVDPTSKNFLSNLMVIGVYNENIAANNEQKDPAVKIKSMSFEGPLYKSWPPASHKRIFISSRSKNNEFLYAKQILKSFMTKAFRRKVYDSEVSRYLKYWRSVRNLKPSFEESIKETLVTILCSPNFLYIIEKKAKKAKIQTAKRTPLSEFELANRLSYFLWNSMPDSTIFRSASKGSLKKNLPKHLKRMLANSKFQRFIQPFTKQWLDLHFMDQVQINVNLYGHFNRFVDADMRTETYEFVSKVFKDDLSLMNFIDSDFVMLNQNMAQFYGIDGVKGANFRAVTVPRDKNRGGLLSQGSFLTGHSSGDDSHPIKRGTWLIKKILDTPPPPPPPNVPLIPEDDPNFAKLTKKEQLEKHRDNPSCRDCHKKIDPFGVAFEDYDAVGLWRDRVNKFDHNGKRVSLDIVSKAELPDKTEITGVASLKKYILEKRKKDVTRSLTKHLLSYALGRSLSFTDEDEIEEIIKKTEESGYKTHTLLEAIVTSKLFTSK